MNKSGGSSSSSSDDAGTSGLQAATQEKMATMKSKIFDGYDTNLRNCSTFRNLTSRSLISLQEGLVLLKTAKRSAMDWIGGGWVVR